MIVQAEVVQERGPAQLCGEKRCQEFCRWPACLPSQGQAEPVDKPADAV